jgi:hypothetical protein
MPIESFLLENAKSPIHVCPKCGTEPFRPFMRGQVQRGYFTFAFLRALWRKEHYPYCALICWECKEIVGYE